MSPDAATRRPRNDADPIPCAAMPPSSRCGPRWALSEPPAAPADTERAARRTISTKAVHPMTTPPRARARAKHLAMTPYAAARKRRRARPLRRDNPIIPLRRPTELSRTGQRSRSHRQPLHRLGQGRGRCIRLLPRRPAPARGHSAPRGGPMSPEAAAPKRHGAHTLRRSNYIVWLRPPTRSPGSASSLASTENRPPP